MNNNELDISIKQTFKESDYLAHVVLVDGTRVALCTGMSSWSTRERAESELRKHILAFFPALSTEELESFISRRCRIERWMIND